MKKILLVSIFFRMQNAEEIITPGLELVAKIVADDVRPLTDVLPAITRECHEFMTMTWLSDPSECDDFVRWCARVRSLRVEMKEHKNFGEALFALLSADTRLAFFDDKQVRQVMQAAKVAGHTAVVFSREDGPIYRSGSGASHIIWAHVLRVLQDHAGILAPDWTKNLFLRAPRSMLQLFGANAFASLCTNSLTVVCSAKFGEKHLAPVPFENATSFQIMCWLALICETSFLQPAEAELFFYRLLRPDEPPAGVVREDRLPFIDRLVNETRQFTVAPAAAPLYLAQIWVWTCTMARSASIDRASRRIFHAELSADCHSFLIRGAFIGDVMELLCVIEEQLIHFWGQPLLSFCEVTQEPRSLNVIVRSDQDLTGLVAMMNLSVQLAVRSVEVYPCFAPLAHALLFGDGLFDSPDILETDLVPLEQLRVAAAARMMSTCSAPNFSRQANNIFVAYARPYLFQVLRLYGLSMSGDEVPEAIAFNRACVAMETMPIYDSYFQLASDLIYLASTMPITPTEPYNVKVFPRACMTDSGIDALDDAIAFWATQRAPREEVREEITFMNLHLRKFVEKARAMVDPPLLDDRIVYDIGDCPTYWVIARMLVDEELSIETRKNILLNMRLRKNVFPPPKLQLHTVHGLVECGQRIRPRSPFSKYVRLLFDGIERMRCAFCVAGTCSFNPFETEGCRRFVRDQDDESPYLATIDVRRAADIWVPFGRFSAPLHRRMLVPERHVKMGCMHLRSLLSSQYGELFAKYEQRLFSGNVNLRAVNPLDALMDGNGH